MISIPNIPLTPSHPPINHPPPTHPPHCPLHPQVTAQGALVFQRAGLKRKYALLLYMAALMSAESGLTRTAHILLQKCSKQYGETTLAVTVAVAVAVAGEPLHASSAAPNSTVRLFVSTRFFLVIDSFVFMLYHHILVLLPLPLLPILLLIEE